MAKSKRRNGARPTSNRPTDAVALLKADHRTVKSWFEEFESARKATRKQELASSICRALRIHMTVEEEIFYPAFLAATQDDDMNDEAVVEHDGAKNLIAKIEKSNPAAELYDAQVHVLSEMIKHHVKEEEQPGGMFAEARESKMDLVKIGEQIAQRKAQLEGRTGE
jgi:hemerythrin superfamily protein